MVNSIEAICTKCKSRRYITIYLDDSGNSDSKLINDMLCRRCEVDYLKTKIVRLNELLSPIKKGSKKPSGD